MSVTIKRSFSMKAIPERRKLKEIPAPARKLAAEAIGIDSPIDTVQRVLVMGENLGKRGRRSRGHSAAARGEGRTRRFSRCGFPSIFRERRRGTSTALSGVFATKAIAA